MSKLSTFKIDSVSGQGPFKWEKCHEIEHVKIVGIEGLENINKFYTIIAIEYLTNQIKL